MKRETFLRVIVFLMTMMVSVSYTYSQRSFCASMAALSAGGECGLGEFTPGISYEDFARHAVWLPFIEVGSERFEADAFVFDGDCEGSCSGNCRVCSKSWKVRKHRWKRSTLLSISTPSKSMV